MRTRLLPWLLAVAPALAACAPSNDEDLGVAGSSIINGQLDTVNQAVVAVFSDNGGCTGTLIYAASGSAYVLTAAHCFGGSPVQYVVRGNDYENPDQVLEVVDYQVHPKYTGNDPNSNGGTQYDFAMIRAKFAASNVPQILPLSPDEDELKVGTPIEHSGYGLIKSPNGSTTKRHRAFGVIDQLTKIELAYNQPNSGPCSGDSGGPQLVDTPAGKRVAGVVSYGDQDCAVYGVSGRVSAVYDSFIVPFVGSLPNSGGSSSSSTSASSSAATSGAGGSSSDAATSSGVGASGAGGAGETTSGAGASDLWTAGDAQATKHEGYLLSSACAVNSGSGDAELPWGLVAGVGALAAVARRRGTGAGSTRRG